MSANRSRADRLSRAPVPALLLAVLLPAGGHGETFELANGDSVTGEVVERTDDRIVLRHPVFGELTLPVSELKPEKGPNGGLFGTRFLEGWNRQLELGLNGSDGNTETQNVRAAFAFTFEDDTKRWDWNGRYLLNRSSGSTEDQNARLTALRDWLFGNSRWFWFAQAQYDWDPFQAWEQRVSAYTGPGYHFVQKEDFDLFGRVGAGATKELGDDEDDFVPEAFVGLQARWTFDETHTLAFHTRFHPDLSEFGEYRNITGADWSIRLSEANGLSLKLGFENEYESDVPRSEEHNDLTYYGALLFDF